MAQGEVGASVCQEILQWPQCCSAQLVSWPQTIFSCVIVSLARSPFSAHGEWGMPAQPEAFAPQSTFSFPALGEQTTVRVGRLGAEQSGFSKRLQMQTLSQSD